VCHFSSMGAVCSHFRFGRSSSSLLQDLIERSRGCARVPSCACCRGNGIQVSHPLSRFLEPRAFDIAKDRLALAKLRLQDAYILLRQLQFQARHLFRRIRFLTLRDFWRTPALT